MHTNLQLMQTRGVMRCPPMGMVSSIPGTLNINLAAISCLAIAEKFTPVSANIKNLDPEAEGVPIVTHPLTRAPETVMSNSSGFGGSNVSLIFGPAR